MADTQVSQIPALVLGAEASDTHISQVAVLVMTQPVTPTEISQLVMLVLVRERKKRVMSIADTRN